MNACTPQDQCAIPALSSEMNAVQLFVQVIRTGSAEDLLVFFIVCTTTCLVFFF